MTSELRPLEATPGRMEAAHAAQLATTRRQTKRAYAATQELIDQAHHEARGLVVDPNETPAAPVDVVLNEHDAPTDTEQCEFNFARRVLLNLAGACVAVGLVITALFCLTHYLDAALIAAGAFIASGVLLRVRRNL